MPIRLSVGLLLAAVAASAGCQTLGRVKDRAYTSVRSLITDSYHDPQAEAKMAKGEQLLADGRYSDAQDVFADLADNTYNPLLLAEKARYLEAECLRQRKRYPDAVATYNRMLQDFPAGAYREPACARIYEIAYVWLEKDVLADIEAEQNGTRPPWWQRKPPLPNLLDRTRPTFDIEGESLKALEHVQTHDLLGPNADKALFWSGYVHFYRGRFEDADYYFSQLVEMHKESKLRPVALEMAILAKAEATGGAVYDSTKAAEALKLVHHAEASDPLYAQDDKKAQWLTRQKLAVRQQLAEKYFRMAEYYERTNHLPSAYFYYELVCRQHPGTRYSDLAKARMAELDKLRVKLEAEKAEGRYDGTSGFFLKHWDRLTGRPSLDEPGPPEDRPASNGPAGTPAFPSQTNPADPASMGVPGSPTPNR